MWRDEPATPHEAVLKSVTARRDSTVGELPMSPTFKALAALSVCLLCAQAFAQSRQADHALCSRGQGVEEFRACLRLANQGNRGAQFNLALMYRKGTGVNKDPALAASWYRKAAEQGFGLAQGALGEMYEQGEGVPKDLSQAMYWYWHATAKSGQSATIASVKEEDAKTTNAAPDRREPVDLGDSKESLLDSVVLVWRSASNPRNWGSGFLISKCHVMTSHHVVFDQDKDEEMKIGKHVVVGLGQTNSPPWKSDIALGTVVGFDPKVRNVTPTGRVEYFISRDWAIVKLNKDKFGKYPGKLKPFCLGEIDKAAKLSEVKTLPVRSIGHPADQLLSTGNLQLWQDKECKVLSASGGIWETTCQFRSGMSGGPVATLESSLEGGCWKPLGVISSSKWETGGFPPGDLTGDELKDVRTKNIANKFSPLDRYNRKIIDKAIEASPCD